ncbi:MAG: ATP-binding cassette domain-containing protein [Deltaproteobacteria bacterium]|nr:ATP-binding cassette domain-containing protein [Deltaproteobacteria bacterium]
MIEVMGLTKYYGSLAAIRDVNFNVSAGEIVGFLGPNGAGKTTTMRILTCFAPATSGSVRISGIDVGEDSMAVRRSIGYLPENVPLYNWMRVRNYLEFVTRAKGVASSDRVKEIDRVSSVVGIEDVQTKLIRWLSKGYKQRLGLAQALIGDPPIIILDEPTIGLDPKQIREIRNLIKGFALNKTVILSSHILPEVSHVCSRVIIINKGVIVAEDTPENLISGSGRASRVQVTLRAPEHESKTLISGINGVSTVKTLTPFREGMLTLTVESEWGKDIRPELARSIVAKDWDLLDLRSIDVSLEDVFIDLVTEESTDVLTKENLMDREVA